MPEEIAEPEVLVVAEQQPTRLLQDRLSSFALHASLCTASRGRAFTGKRPTWRRQNNWWWRAVGHC